MQMFLTLVVSPGTTDCLENELENLVSGFAGNGCPVSHMHWLSESIACDLLFNDGDAASIEQTARTFFAGKPVDILSGTVSNRRKKLLIADMDSTIVTSETLDDLASHVGLKEEIAAITAKSMLGDLGFEASVRKRVGMIAGLSLSAIEDTLADVKLSPGAKALVRTMRAHGAHTALVSGGFSVFAEPISMWCGFHEHRSNSLDVVDDKLTGEVLDPILGPEAKLSALDSLAALEGVNRDDALAIGDGANDLDMIKAAGLGVAYYGKPVLLDAARASIQHTDLTTALYYQGYSDAEFLVI